MKIGQTQLFNAVKTAGNVVKKAVGKLDIAKNNRALQSDVVEISGQVTETVAKQSAAISEIVEASAPDIHLTKHLTALGEKKLFNREMLAFLTKNRNADGELVYDDIQRSVISGAVKKVNRLKTIAHKIADDGRRAEKEAYEEIRDLFGPKYKDCIAHRAKSKESTFDKLVNHLREDIDKFRNELYKEYFKGSYKKASDEDKQKFYNMIVSGKIELSDVKWGKFLKLFSRTKQEYRDSKSIVMDQIGTRLLLPTGSKKETEEVTNIIEKAIKAQKVREKLCYFYPLYH